MARRRSSLPPAPEPEAIEAANDAAEFEPTQTTPEDKAAAHEVNMQAVANDPGANPHPSPGQHQGAPSPGEGPLQRPAE